MCVKPKKRLHTLLQPIFHADGTWTRGRHVYGIRNDPLACDGMLPENLPSSVVLRVTADNETPCTSIRLPNIKETLIYLCPENHREKQHQREPPTESI